MSDGLAYHLFAHDLRFVLLAAVICALSSLACLSLMAHARRSQGPRRALWLGVAAISVGFGIWSTHFVAMLAFDVGFAVSYDIGLTAASLAIAILVCGTGLTMAVMGNRGSDMVLGGAIVGLGISTMHYIGMQALHIGGDIGWNAGLVAGSVLLGMGFAALALHVGSNRRTLKARLGGAGLLTLAICAMHFTGMGAAGFENCYPIAIVGDLRPQMLSLIIGLASILILLAALSGLYFDARDKKRSEAEEARMRGLADAAVEGLLVCKDRSIVAVNASFRRLLGDETIEITGRDIAGFLASTGCHSLFARANSLVETELTALDGQRIPVEVIRREVDYGGKPHQAIAVRDLRARKKAEHHIRFLAHHDAMTGLANRSSFARHLDDAIAHPAADGGKLAVLCLDLDRFKEVNDLFGHATGDAMLQKVAAVLEDVLDEGQVAGRLGGDEFAVILPHIASPAAAEAVARTLLKAFAEAEDATSTGRAISASIGIAIHPDHADEADQLMNFADTALYCAKDEGRGTFRMFEAQMGAQVRDRRRLEHDLRIALAGERLSLVYQPQVSLRSGEVTGFETLVRWTHPERGAVPPSTFIPIAEETGIILNLGEWVMRSACREAASWTKPLLIAVNVSPVQLHAPYFVEFVQDVLLETGLAPERLEIEITETAMIRNMSRAIASLSQLKALGIKVAMDDFGTGYSSLSNLRAFPFDRIKVDQSFIRAVDGNEQSAAIVKAVLGLGKGLNLPILAEGVERIEEIDFLRGEVCDSAQGYWFGKPRPIAAYEDVVRGKKTMLANPDVTVLAKASA